MKDGIWACRLTLAIICDEICDLSFCLAIDDKMFGNYRVAHVIRGLLVTCV